MSGAPSQQIPQQGSVTPLYPDLPDTREWVGRLIFTLNGAEHKWVAAFSAGKSGFLAVRPRENPKDIIHLEGDVRVFLKSETAP